MIPSLARDTVPFICLGTGCHCPTRPDSPRSRCRYPVLDGAVRDIKIHSNTGPLIRSRVPQHCNAGSKTQCNSIKNPIRSASASVWFWVPVLQRLPSVLTDGIGCKVCYRMSNRPPLQQTSSRLQDRTAAAERQLARSRLCAIEGGTGRQGAGCRRAPHSSGIPALRRPTK